MMFLIICEYIGVSNGETIHGGTTIAMDGFYWNIRKFTMDVFEVYRH